MASAFKSLISELENETDRGCVVLAIAWIEDELTKLLKAKCLPTHQKNDDEIFGVAGPVGTFSAKIDLAYRLGVIRQKTKKSLHLCRRLRNDFAHLTNRLSFAEPTVKDRVQEIFRFNEIVLDAIWTQLKCTEGFKEKYPDFVSNEGIKGLESILGTRTLFDFTAASVVSGLIYTKGEVKPIQPLTEYE